jgi:excisionase family DNA binding protein
MSDPAVVLLLERLLGEVQALRAAVEAKPPVPPAAPTEPEGLWDAKQVAAYLGCSKSWVYDAEAAGRLPAMHVGGMLRFDPAAIRDLGRGKTPPGGRLLRLTE